MKRLPIKIIFSFFIALLIAVLLRSFCIDILAVEGHSMDSTLYRGQPILVNRLAFGLVLPLTDTYIFRWSQPRRNDIVIFRDPVEQKYTIKRCVGIAGDLFRISDNTLYINSFSYPLSSSEGKELEKSSSIPQGTVLLIGDNFKNSKDSRDYGFISIEAIIGKMVY